MAKLTVDKTAATIDTRKHVRVQGHVVQGHVVPGHVVQGHVADETAVIPRYTSGNGRLIVAGDFWVISLLSM